MPSNNSPSTAFAIPTIPSTVSSSAPDFVDTELWWFYEPLVTDFFIGILARSSNGAIFVPRVDVWIGNNPLSLTFTGTTGRGLQPLNAPVILGTRVYVQVQDNVGGDSGETFTLSFLYPPAAVTPVGSLVIPDENPAIGGADFPAIALAPGSGVVLRAVQYCPCERGDILPSGIALMQNVDTGDLDLYDATPTKLLTVTGLAASTGDPIASDHAHTFYVAQGGVSNVVWTVSEAGVIGGTTWTLPAGAGAPRAIAPFRDGSVLLYTRAGLGNPVKAFDLLTLSALPDFATAPSASHTSLKEMFVLADGTVVIGWHKIAGGRDFILRQYAANGTILHSYSLLDAAFVALDYRIAINAADDSTSIWLRRFPNTFSNYTQFSEVRLSDGVLLQDSAVHEFNAGIGPADGDAGTDPPRFGPSDSCPFWALPVPWTPVILPGVPGCAIPPPAPVTPPAACAAPAPGVI